jgi:ComF family protein
VHRDCLEQTFLDGVVVCYHYNDFVEEVIKTIKYKFAFAVIEDVARLMQTHLQSYQLQVDAVCAVPLSGRKRAWRGFNQAELLAKRLAAQFSAQYVDLLKRNKHTKTQVGLSRVDRLENLHNIFSSKSTNLTYKRVLIVDDVMTTGSTLEQCAKVLKANGVEQVYGLVFARG